MSAEWKVCEKYAVGDHRSWRGVELVCTLAHYAGERAVPWDPGCGWSVAKAAAMWAPNGEVEDAKLRGVITEIGESRLHDVLREVTR